MNIWCNLIRLCNIILVGFPLVTRRKWRINPTCGLWSLDLTLAWVTYLLMTCLSCIEISRGLCTTDNVTVFLFNIYLYFLTHWPSPKTVILCKTPNLDQPLCLKMDRPIWPQTFLWPVSFWFIVTLLGQLCQESLTDKMCYHSLVLFVLSLKSVCFCLSSLGEAVAVQL